MSMVLICQRFATGSGTCNYSEPCEIAEKYESFLHERVRFLAISYGEKPHLDSTTLHLGAALNNYDYKSNKKRQGSIIVFPVSFFYIEPAYNCFAL